MSTALDLEVLPDILEAITEIGVSTTFTLGLGAGYDPATGGVTPDPEVHVVTTSPVYEPRVFFRPGDLIPEADGGIAVAGQGLPFTPVMAMQVASAGSTYTVVRIERHRAGDDVAAYVILLNGVTT